MSIEKKFAIVYLLGAGSSRPAGIPTISEMTEGFLRDPFVINTLATSRTNDLKHTLRGAIDTISHVASRHFPKSDLEYMMTLILSLEEETSRGLFEMKYPELRTISPEVLNQIKALIIDFIRYACEKIGPSDVDYLWSLRGLSDDGILHIFTLNYDSTIELFCERNAIAYSDGFGPSWNPAHFDTANIKIFKLHGSLYWLKTESGKFIKVPVKGLPINNVKYLTDEKVSEMMIYPALQKDRQSEIYLWLFRRFIDALDESQLCVVVGYSFRDKEILDNIRDALHRNPHFWLIIVSPNAWEHKEQHFHALADEMQSRILKLDWTTQEAITERKLHEYLTRLESIIRAEENVWKSQSKVTYRTDIEWWSIIINYLRLDNFERVAWIYGMLSKQSFSDLNGDASQIMENLLGPASLRCLTLYYLKRQYKKMSLWKRMFLEYSRGYEHHFFDSLEALKDSNPIGVEQIPFWKIRKGFHFNAGNIKELKTWTQILENNARSDPLKLACRKYINTLDLLMRIPSDPRPGSPLPADLLQKYHEVDLGVNKWCIKILEELEH